MGGGIYSMDSRSVRSETLGYTTKGVTEIFTQKSINNAMNPHGIKIRESRDSDEHPVSVAIVLALDVTGSMGNVPHHLVKEGLPKIMDGIIQSGIKDPQLLFLGIGDHECDHSPLQIGQFESSDELLDKWLTDVYLEGGGGGNMGESYLLAWYFAAQHTSIDCFEKRKRKGFLFTIGDEPVLPKIPTSALKEIMGSGQYEDYTSTQLLEKARKMYHVYHLHIKETYSGERQHVMDGWKQLIGDHLIIIENHENVSKEIMRIVSETELSKLSSSVSDSAPDTTEEIL